MRQPYFEFSPEGFTSLYNQLTDGIAEQRLVGMVDMGETGTVQPAAALVGQLELTGEQAIAAVIFPVHEDPTRFQPTSVWQARLFMGELTLGRTRVRLQTDGEVSLEDAAPLFELIKTGRLVIPGMGKPNKVVRNRAYQRMAGIALQLHEQQV